MAIGSKVLAVRHRKVHSKQELLNCNLGDKDIWLRISDPASKNVAPCRMHLGSSCISGLVGPSFPLSCAVSDL